MSYTSFPQANFGKGLNLVDKPDAVDPAECIDAMNVVFSDRGAILQRPGYADLTEALTNRVDSLSPFYTTGGTKQLLAGAGTRLEALSNAGEVLTSVTGMSGGPWGFARFGKPNTEVAYAGNGEDTLRKWDGTEWTAPTATVDEAAGKAMPKAGLLAAWPDAENRLIAAGFKTATGGPNSGISSPSHVYFSEPGDAESWTSTAYEELTPGDGEAIMGLIQWRELVFVFKETKFFVFYGSSTNTEGNPSFNFRSVESGVGLASSRALCADASGVYFLDRKGVYRTTGQAPELISAAISPIFDGNASAFYTGGELASAHITECAMHAFREQIYLSFPTESVNDRTLIYDPAFQWWSLTDLPIAAACVFRPGSAEELLFAYAAGEKKVGRYKSESGYTNDAEAAIVSRWRSGWFDLNNPDVKTIRSSKFWGTGNAFCGLSHDYEEGTGNLVALDMSVASVTEWGKSTWGGGEWALTPALRPAFRQIATRGTIFSLYFFNNLKDQDWSIHRADHHLRETRKPSTVTA